MPTSLILVEIMFIRLLAKIILGLISYQRGFRFYYVGNEVLYRFG